MSRKPSERYLHTAIQKEMDSENFSRALELANMGISLYPRENVFYEAKTVIYQMMGRYEDSIEWSEKCLDRVPCDQHAYFSKALSLFELRRYRHTVESATMALLYDPNNLDVMELRARAYAELGDCERSFSDICPLMLQISSALIEEVDVSDAASKLLSLFDRIIEKNPQYSKAYSGRSALLATLGKEREALDAAEKARDLKPNDPVVYIQTSILLAKLGEHKKAKCASAKAMELMEALNEC